ncbi:MAG: hypothetical protein LH614_07870 [Pyrinomonadaceae bacterium]|nr:hypothetical protein [Pyrinomonadaceae bacterium]
MTEKKSEDKKDAPKKSRKTPFWELVIAAAGLFLVVVATGTTLYRAMTEETTPPQIKVSFASSEPSGDGYLVKFRVVNSGNQTAAAVTIEGELKNGTESVETSSATLTYAPANSERRGGLYFSKNPQQFDLQIRATGYEEP